MREYFTDKHKRVMNLLVICLMIGSLSGAIIANNISAETLTKINSQLKVFFSNKNSLHTNSMLITFLYEFAKNIKLILFVWIIAFSPVGEKIILLIMFIKSLTYGFSNAIILKSNLFILTLSDKNIWYILLINTIYMFAVIVFVLYCLRYSYTLRAQHSFISTKRKRNITIEYFSVLILILALTFLILLIEIYFYKKTT
jgi:uncharacterized membrane protein SpoIIM required for sporulation